MASYQMKLFIKMLMGSKTYYDPNNPKDYASIRLANDQRSQRMKLPRGISVQTEQIKGTPIEIYTPKNPKNNNVIFYIHGGGFNSGTLISSRPFAMGLVHKLNMRVISIQYKLAPEYKYPTQLEECMAVYQWALDGIAKNSKIILLGDSAGGNLVLALTLYLMDQKIALPAAVCALSPATDFTGTLSSRVEKESRDCMITRTFDQEIRDTYIGTAPVNHPYVAPLHGNFESFPPLRIDVGTEEMLLDDSLLLEKKAKGAGVKVELHVWEGLCHVFPVFPIPESKKYFKELAAFIERFS